MVTSPASQPPLADLLKALEAAVLAGDRAQATQLEQTILQRLASEAAQRDEIERRVRKFMQILDQPTVGPPLFFDPFDAERGGPEFYARGDYESAVRGEPELYIDDVERGEAASDMQEGKVHRVWFATNRQSNAQGDGFTGKRHRQFTWGRVDVYVPQAHRFGETGTDFWTRLSRFDLRDDRLRIQQLATQSRGDFFADIHAEMQAARDSGKPPHALCFIHGYNVSFEEAAIRAAQLGCDLKIPGATAFFSWPSRGKTEFYPADEASIQASEWAITEFLVDFTQNCGAEKVHVIAHSMGNRGLLRALQRIAASAETRGQIKFGQVFLAAPDIDRDLFLDLARLYPEHAERTTLYASDRDLPVHLSARLHDAPRAGYFEPYTVTPGIDTVAVPNFNVDLMGHSYFAEAEALLYDIRDLMLNNLSPDNRQRIDPMVYGGQSFWRLRR
ncbi:MAG: alpha/beta hydrolase [Cyanobacteria bacterium J06635_1]